MNGKSTILIVDDQKVMRETIGMFLSGDSMSWSLPGMALLLCVKLPP